MTHELFLMQLLESEVTRLSHLRDRASDLGRRKEYPCSWNSIINFAPNLFSWFLVIDFFYFLLYFLNICCTEEWILVSGIYICLSL